MNISKVIKERRKALGMTQEQVADRLGVSAPAVNKWENSVTFPDITLLPALARLLETDLNTLMSFREEMTSTEIAAIQESIYMGIGEKGFCWAFEEAMKKIEEYPACHGLICSMALFLSGTMMLDPSISAEERSKYDDEFEKLFHRAAESSDPQIKDHALSMLIAKCVERDEYEEARRMIEQISEPTVDKFNMQITLARKLGDEAEAAKLAETKLMQSITDAQTALMRMAEIAISEKRLDDAEFFAEKCKEVTIEFDLMKATSYVSLLEVAVQTKNREKTLNLLEEMLNSMNQLWKLSSSRFYTHVGFSESGENFGKMFLPALLKGIEEDEEFAFLRGDAKLQDILERVKAAIRCSL